jgi:ubiquinone/menaquinone biosynthesis C-methylase UbiE
VNPLTLTPTPSPTSGRGANITAEKNIYDSQAEQYERLVAREDYQGNILSALRRITPFEGLEVLELGAGTGRLTRLLAPEVHRITAFDLSLSMLQVAASELRNLTDLASWHLAAADHRYLPVRAGVADVVLSGWSICYLVTWNEARWQDELDLALVEIQRALRPGGKIILLETLGTGFERPTAPEHLTQYYRYLEAQGFHPTWIRTDYRFESLAEAEELSSFFFGEELANKVVQHRWTILPECTGIWWKTATDQHS